MQRKIWRCYHRTCLARLWTTSNPDEGVIDVRGVHDHPGEQFDTVLQSRMDLAAYLGNLSGDSTASDGTIGSTENGETVAERVQQLMTIGAQNKRNRRRCRIIGPSLEVGSAMAIEYDNESMTAIDDQPVQKKMQRRQSNDLSLSSSPRTASTSTSTANVDVTPHEMEQVQIILNSMCAVARMDMDRVLEIVSVIGESRRKERMEKIKVESEHSSNKPSTSSFEAENSL